MFVGQLIEVKFGCTKLNTYGDTLMTKFYTTSVDSAPIHQIVAQQEQSVVPVPVLSHRQSTEGILRVKELARYLSVSRSSIYNLMDIKSKYYKASFPKPIALSLRAKGWLKSEIDAYLEHESKKANTPEAQNH